MMAIDGIWMWSILGVILLAAEIATGTIYILWFGISALCVSLALFLIPSLSTTAQLLLFSALSIGSLAIWKLYFKKKEVHHRIGQSQGEEIGRVGIMKKGCSSTENGMITFSQGLMGSKKWTAVSSETIKAGQEAKVVAVEGNSLRVVASN